MTDFPYAGLIQREKEIVGSLTSMPLDYLRQNYEAFDDIVGMLMASHIDVGCAYIAEKNEAPFPESSRWLPVDRPRSRRGRPRATRGAGRQARRTTKSTTSSGSGSSRPESSGAVSRTGGRRIRVSQTVTTPSSTATGRDSSRRTRARAASQW